MSFLKDIRKQPEHIRKIMFGLSVITTFSFVGIIWFNSLQKTLVALMNTDSTTEKKLAENNDGTSLFGNIGQSFIDLTKSMRATIGNVFNKQENIDMKEDTKYDVQGSAHPLPLSDKKY